MLKMEDIFRSGTRRTHIAQQLGIPFVVLKLLLVASSRQLTWNFTASNVNPPNTNGAASVASWSIQETTNLISWDNGVTKNPIYSVFKSGAYIALWDQNNQMIANESFQTGNGHLVDGPAKRLFADYVGSDNGPAIYDLSYSATGPTVTVTKSLAYQGGANTYFANFPVQSFDGNSYYYIVFKVIGASFMGVSKLDSGSSSTNYVKTYSYNPGSDETIFQLIATSSQMSAILFITYTYVSTNPNELKAIYLSKVTFTSVGSKVTLTTAQGNSSTPSSTLATLDNLDETKLYFVNQYDQLIYQYSRMFDTSATTLTKSMASSTSIALSASYQFVGTVNLGPFAFLAGINENNFNGYSASIYSKADLSLLAWLLKLQTNGGSPKMSLGMVLNGFYQNGGLAVLPFGTFAICNSAVGAQHIITNITFNLCLNSTYLSLSDSKCYAVGSFPPKMGNYSEAGSPNLTIASCSDPNCNACAALYTTCTQCNSGYYLNSSSQCSPCQTGCAKCSSATTCSECLAGYTLNGDSCTIIPTPTNNTTTNNSTINNTTGVNTTNNATETNSRSNSKALAIGIGLGFGVGVGVPVLLGGVIVLLTKLGVFKMCFGRAFRPVS